jgi:hypothetical protein
MRTKQEPLAAAYVWRAGDLQAKSAHRRMNRAVQAEVGASAQARLKSVATRRKRDLRI